ncbi:Protein kinase of the Mitotic Exit Network [Coemansia sp. RSA 2618]|nr:Protein kinase of the Mitotic Exit Network [Coemansia sp. RSA 2618]
MTTKSSSSSHHGEFRPEQLFGQLKAEQQSRNYDTAARFIATVLGEQLDACTLRETLRDGVVLCRLINALRPGAVKRINTKRLPFTQMENISNFLSAAQSLGLDSSDLFQTVDLYEGKNMPRVVMTLLAIARVVARIPLNSHRKPSDAQRTLGDGWNSTTLTGHDGMPLVTPPADYVSERYQPTLVNSANATSTPATVAMRELSLGEELPLIHAPASPRSIPLGSSSSRRERRRSKRRSAATLFVASTDRPVSMPPIAAVESDASAESDHASAVLDNQSSYVSDDQAGTISDDQAGTISDDQAGIISDDQVSNSGSSSNTHAADLPDSPPVATTAMLATPPASAKAAPDASDKADQEAPVRPRKRTTTNSRPKERLTVYSESAQRLTNYQLGNCIGRGQFGAVYRALDLETGEMVAVKQISLAGQDTENMDDVMQEVDLLKSLSNPRIVRYYGFVKTDAHLNLVMEFVENGSLSATLKSFGTFPERLVLAYAVKIIEGLIYLHARDVVHCDLKACNILTTKNGNTKLTDFGVSLNLKLRRPGDESVVAGTPYWMAPEIIQLEGACTASDIWSLGCTVIELLTGKPPYSGMMQMAALYRIVEDDHPPIPDGISEELKDFLLQCFRKEPTDRPTAAELMNHSWTQQYRRNRKEMKMLRRTCSRKMSSYIARKRTARNYPAFNPTQLKSVSMAKRKSKDSAGDAESWEEEKEEEGETKALNEDVPAAASPEPSSPPTLAEVPGVCDETAQALDDVAEPASPAPANCGFASSVGTTDIPSTRDTSGAAASGEDTDASISTFEGPRLKQHRLRTILCDSGSVCAVCSRALIGAFIQCTSCKIRCHDACTLQLQTCSAMRMSRFLYPANRKSSKRYESKTPRIRLRATRKSTVRRQHGRHTPVSEVNASVADIFGSTCGSHAGGLLGSSDGSLHMANLRASVADSRLGMVHDGFDGFIDSGAQPARPASIAVAMSLPADEMLTMHGSGRRWAAAMDRNSVPAVDSGWETDDTATPFSQNNRSLREKQQDVHVAGISIPQARRGVGPYSAPLANGSVPEVGADGRVSMHRPLYYKPLADDPLRALPPRVGSITPLSDRARPRSIRRMRANTASLECLSGPQLTGGGQERSSISTLFKRRQHPLRSGTQTDLRAVAGFSPGAAQRAKRTFHGSDASISDLQSCTTSEFYSRSELGLPSRASTQCFSVSGKFADKSAHSKSFKDCIIM